MKIEMQDFKEIGEKADKAGMIEDKNIKEEEKYTFQIVAKEDPKLALAGLRVELENKLRKLALKNDLDMNYKGLGQILRVLSAHDLITQEEQIVLSDMTGMLNAAVHSEAEKYDYRNVSWAIDVGVKILNSLDKRMG